jgi:hypothetical protein
MSLISADVLDVLVDAKDLLHHEHDREGPALRRRPAIEGS